MSCTNTTIWVYCLLNYAKNGQLHTRKKALPLGTRPQQCKPGRLLAHRCLQVSHIFFCIEILLKNKSNPEKQTIIKFISPPAASNNAQEAKKWRKLTFYEVFIHHSQVCFLEFSVWNFFKKKNHFDYSLTFSFFWIWTHHYALMI